MPTDRRTTSPTHTDPPHLADDGRIVGPDLLTEAEVAGLLRVRRETLWSWRRRGVIVGVRVGSRMRYRRADVDAVLGRAARS